MIGQFSHAGLRRFGIAVLVAAASTLATFGLPARADDPRHDPRQPAGAGEIVPLEQLLARVRRDYGGRVLKVELEGEDREGEAGWFYEVKVLTPEGNVLKLEYDATSMELLEARGHFRLEHEDKDD
ncbi:MAG: PepSY domain-containing protein [Pirellulales bacterium]